MGAVPGRMMVLENMIEDDAAAVALLPVRKATFESWLEGREARLRQWVAAAHFTAETGTFCPVPDTVGGLAMVLASVGEEDDPWAFAALPAKLPPGSYRLVEEGLAPEVLARAALGWCLATYAFSRYKTGKSRVWSRLVWPQGVDRGHVRRAVEAFGLARDLINTPAADLGPAELAAAAETLAARHGASVRVVDGEALRTGYPMVHAVGRAAAARRGPRLIDFTWGEPGAPRVTLVGKGVCFDSGGLDIKPSSGMKLMKKDMGGAALVLGLASMVMDAGLPLRLRVLIPAVENAVDGEAMRPLDVLGTRKGITVEVGNTDAEGRLILADALWEAAAERPEILIDAATLTGAARVALGPDLPALFSNDDALAAEILAAGTAETDPLWRLPLHKPYRRLLDSKVADLANVSDGPYAGAITAALFLQEFVPAGIAWAHIDTLAWNTGTRPGRPEGGEALALRALYRLLADRFPVA